MITQAPSVLAQASSPDFNVTVNTGAVPPNSDTVFPGQATSLRITLSNSSEVTELTNVAYSGQLQNSPEQGLVIDEVGVAAISGTDCTGTLTVTPGASAIEFFGITVPVRQPGVGGSGECYVDLPVRAFSRTGASTTQSLNVAAGDVTSDQGTNSTGGPQAITVRAVQRPTVSKTFVPNNLLVLNGASRTLRITISNPDTNIALNEVALTDVFPAPGAGGAIFEPTGAAATGSCIGPGVTVSPSGGPNAQVAVSGVSVPAGGSCTVDVEVRGRQSEGVYEATGTNVIDNDSFSSREGPRPSADASAPVRVRSPLGLSKIFNPTVLASGTQGSFTVTLSNASGSPLPVSSFTDDPIGAPAPANVTIASAGDVVNSCGGVATLTAGGQGFSVGSDFAGGAFSIPANGNCVITVNFTAVNSDPDTPVVYTNSIPQGAVQIDGQPEIVSQARSATVIVADRLRVLKSRTPAEAAPGDPVRYSVTLQNFSTTLQSDVTLEDTLQNGSTLLLGGAFDPTLSAACGVLDTNGAAQGDSSINFTIPVLGGRTGPGSPGECVVSFSVMISPSATGATSNVIGAGGFCLSDGTTCNQGASNNVTTDFRSPATLIKTFDGQNAVTRREGVPVRLRLELRNASTSPLTGVVFSDTLVPAGAFQQLRVASPPNVSNSCGGTVTAGAGSTSVALNGGTVPAFTGGSEGSCALELEVVGPAGVYPNEGEATGNRTNADGSVTPIAPLGSALTDTATLTYTSTLAASKSFSPASAGDGGRSTVTVLLENLDPNAPITGVEVVDPLPPGMLVADPSNAYSSCAGPPTVVATAGSGSVSLSGAVLAPEAVCALVFDIEVTGTSDWVNTIPAGNITADGGIVNTAPVDATLSYAPPAVPLISKAINPGTVVPGQSALLTINLTNGADDLTGVTVTDWFTAGGIAGAADNGMRIAPTPEAVTDCPAGVVTALPEGNSVRLSGATLAANSACQIRVRVTSTSVGTVTNRIPLSALQSDQGATNSTTFAESTLSTTSDVGVTKQFLPPVIAPTETSRLRIEFFNGDSTAITGFSLTDTYPAGLENAPQPNAISNCGAPQIGFPDNTSISISDGSIGAAVGNQAATCFLEVDVVAAGEGTYVNEVPQDTLLVGGVPVPHPPATSTLQVRERIVVNKAIDDFTLDAGDPNGFTSGNAVRLPGVVAPLTIRIENPNDIELTEVAFSDQLPDGLTLGASPGLATTCSDGVVSGQPFGRTLRLTGATLGARGDADATCTVTASVVSNVAGVYDNEIAEGDVTSFEGVSNDPGTQARIVVSEPPTVGKDFTPPVIPPGGTARLVITLGNDNDVAATLTAGFVDTLPASPGPMEVAGPATSSCTGSLSATLGGDTITLSSGASIPPGGCLIEVDVTATVTGDYLNNIPVGALRTSVGVSDRPAEAPLSISTLGYISGRVFLDNQAVPDGSFIPGGSTPIPANTIELRSGPNCSGSVLETTTTDAQGNYLFRDLSAGTYSVCQPAQPADTLNSVTSEGGIVSYLGSTGSPGVGSNPGATTSQIVGIVLGDNGNSDEVSGSPENNFSEILPASLSGNVYFDADNDGVFDPEESGIGGVTIELSGPVTVTTTTAADGSWQFDGLPPGDYTVREVQPGGWSDGQDTRGTVGGVAVGDDSASDVVSAIVLGPGDAGIDYNFGEIAPAMLALDARSLCALDAPYVDYSLPGFSAGGAPSVNVRWITGGGRVVEQLSNQPGSGRLLWPGAAVNGAGRGIAWPGWAFIDGQWEEVADDRVPTLTLEVSFGATASTQVTYPPARAGCSTQPPGTAAFKVPVSPRWLLLLTALVLLSAAAPRLVRGAA